MDTVLSLLVRYRPIKVGWCIEGGDFEELRRALRFTYTLWGGARNPIIVLDDLDHAEKMARRYRVDVLCPLSIGPGYEDLLERLPHLSSSLFNTQMIEKGIWPRPTPLLDIRHPIQKLSENRRRFRYQHEHNPDILFEWDSSDPLADILLATFGRFPSASEVGFSYDTILNKLLEVQRKPIISTEPLPGDADHHHILRDIVTWDLLPSPPLWDDWSDPGFYVGEAGDFHDIVTYWNLCASGIDLMFYDPSFNERLDDAKAERVDAFKQSGLDPFSDPTALAVWLRSTSKDKDVTCFGDDVRIHVVDQDILHEGRVQPPVWYFREQDTSGTVWKSSEGFHLSFQLSAKPFFDDPRFTAQHAMVSVSPLVDPVETLQATFLPPCIPELNHYYGSECYFDEEAVRVSFHGLEIITHVTRNDITLNALGSYDLLANVFKVFGISVEPSEAGLIARQLIQQMGGLQGCNVFKIRGVRRLIKEYAPADSFTKGAAEMLIGNVDPQSNRPDFGLYESLRISDEQSGKLKHTNVFRFLVEKGMFRVGLNFKCPRCRLKFWLPIDEVHTNVNCEYCGQHFNVLNQLRDRDWQYRRSGLFGRDDNQQGGVTVAVALQQLTEPLRPSWMMYTTSLNLASVGAAIDTCETDLVVMCRNHEGSIDLVIGECKTGRVIDDNDVANLTKVADALPPDRIRVYLVFAKLGEFSQEEVDRCRAAQGSGRKRVILLSERELEANSLYERTCKEFQIDPEVSSLADMANATHRIYFEPHPRSVS